jgi:hypothetical protein
LRRKKQKRKEGVKTMKDVSERAIMFRGDVSQRLRTRSSDESDSEEEPRRLRSLQVRAPRYRARTKRRGRKQGQLMQHEGVG